MKVVILNDSNPDGVHFGCMRVMQAIRDGLTGRGAQIIASIPHATDWPRSDSLRRQVEAAGLIVINGEGTLHHGGKKARWLLEAVDVAAKTGARTALVNALWQENPPDFIQLAARLDHVFCRDSRSAAELSAGLGREVPWFGDLSLYAPPPVPARPRGTAIVLGDSVHSSVTRRIAQLADPLAGLGKAVSLVPVVNQLRQISPALGGLRRALRKALISMRQRQFIRQFPQTRFVPTDTAYLAEMQAAGLSVTGRFHAACLALVTETPFVAVSSNSWKIEALINDIGLSTDRVVAAEALEAGRIAGRDWSYSAQELENLRSFLAASRSGADRMWDLLLRPGPG